MTKIAKVTIKRFKQLKEFELDLTNTTVLIGANNSGKSSALQALHFAVSVAQTARQIGVGVKWGADKFELSFNPSQLLYSPIADVLALAVDRQIAPEQGVGDHQRDELLRELIGPVVVRAVGNEDRQAVGAVPTP